MRSVPRRPRPRRLSTLRRPRETTAESVWPPSHHLEVTTYDAYASNLRIHFIRVRRPGRGTPPARRHRRHDRRRPRPTPPTGSPMSHSPCLRREVRDLGGTLQRDSRLGGGVDARLGNVPWVRCAYDDAIRLPWTPGRPEFLGLHRIPSLQGKSECRWQRHTRQTATQGNQDGYTQDSRRRRRFTGGIIVARRPAHIVGEHFRPGQIGRPRGRIPRSGILRHTRTSRRRPLPGECSAREPTAIESLA